jgi:hypothetical protein
MRLRACRGRRRIVSEKYLDTINPRGFHPPLWDDAWSAWRVLAGSPGRWNRVVYSGTQLRIVVHDSWIICSVVARATSPFCARIAFTTWLLPSKDGAMRCGKLR